MDPHSSHRFIPVEQLTEESFAPFGDVMDLVSSLSSQSDDAFHDVTQDLAAIDITAAKGRPQIDILAMKPNLMPLNLKVFHRYRLSTRTWIPLLFYPFILVVANREPAFDGKSLRAFCADGRQGINLHAGIWHHTPVAIKRRFGMMALGRRGSGKDLETHTVARGVTIAPIDA